MAPPRSPRSGGAAGPVFDRRAISYGETFPQPLKRLTIQTLEWLTAKPRILSRIRRFEALPRAEGQAFWDQALDVMGISLTTPDNEIARIPQSGPAILVANHPHGLIDGMSLAALIGRRRADYRILTRALLTGIDAAASAYMIAVPFPHEPDSQRKMLAMRKETQDFLAAGGLVALFPAGRVAEAATPFGPAIEGEWHAFTAKLIRTSGAPVVPVCFTGQNSRTYQLAAQISATLRQGLLLSEIARAMDCPQRPVIGHPIPHDTLAARLEDPRRAMDWLRAHVLALGEIPKI